MLTCQQILDFLSDYVEGRLSADERLRFDEHLAVCPPCVDYLADFQTTLTVCRSLRDVERARLPHIPEELVKAILAARHR